MSRCKLLTAAFCVSVAALFSAHGEALAAQCGSAPAGFEAWKREFGAEARARASAPPRSPR